MLNHEKIGQNPERITKIKPFINEYKCEGISFNVTIALNVLYAKKKKYILLMFQNITQIRENKLLF